MRRCIYWVCIWASVLLLNDCKCNKVDKDLNETIDECDPFKYTLSYEIVRKFSIK
jgi:hypothetical protein